MIAFPSMLVTPAQRAGMKVPQNPDDFDREKYPHFFIFCALQLGRSMCYLGEHWQNAKVIAEIPENEIRHLTLQDFIARGLSITT